MKLTGFERWGEATATVMQQALKGQQGDKASHERAMASLGYDLYGHPEPDLPGPTLSPLEQLQVRLFHGYMEIYKTVEALKNIEIYMAVFPHGRNKKIERSAYLSYHFENFLNEIYVLRNRLVAYVKLVLRAYRRSPDKARIETLLNICTELVELTLAQPTRLRGAHVHEHRYHHRELQRLTTWEFVRSHPPFEKARALANHRYLELYRELRKNWRKSVSDSNKELAKLLDVYGTAIVGAIYTGPGDALVPPYRLSSRRPSGRST